MPPGGTPPGGTPPGGTPPRLASRPGRKAADNWRALLPHQPKALAEVTTNSKITARAPSTAVRKPAGLAAV